MRLQILGHRNTENCARRDERGQVIMYIYRIKSVSFFYENKERAVV